MISNNKAFLITFLFFISLSLCGQVPREIRTCEHPESINKNLSILEDATGNLTIKQILQSTEFQNTNKSILNLGVNKSAYWIKFSLKNASSCHKFLLNVDQPLLSNVQFHYFNRSSQKVVSEEIVNSTFTTRHFKYLTFLFGVEIPQGETIDCYVRVTGSAQLMIPLKIGPPEEITNEVITTETLFGFYGGFLLAMVIYNLFIYFTVKDKSYLYYVAYILLICLTQLTLCGFTFKYLWPNSLWLTEQSVNLLSSIVGIAAIMFMQVFLQVNSNFPRMNQVLWFFIVVFILAMILSLAGYLHLSFQIMQIDTLLGSIYMLYIGYRISRKGYRPARFYMYAWSVLLTGAIIFVLKDFELIPYNDFTSHTLHYASGIEVVLLSFALGDRINILEREKQVSRAQAIKILEENERIIREQNVFLETKVTERTNELQITNVELSKTLKNLKEAQAQLVHAEKMASLGQLTAGIAHEINNPINFVTSSINPLRRDLDFINQIIVSAKSFLKEDDKHTRIQHMETLLEDMDYTYLVEEMNMLLHGIQEGSNRTSEIVKSLRNFSRLDETDFKKANIIEGLESTLLLLNSSISDAKIKVKKQFDDIPAITCQPGKLNQVFMNILNNSIYAIKSNKQSEEAGTISIRVREENGAIYIEVYDNGIGMSLKTKERLFEPFFTTKDVGEGTGLGLSIVYTIIEGHQGKINVDSEEGKGTKFIISLPIK